MCWCLVLEVGKKTNLFQDDFLLKYFIYLFSDAINIKLLDAARDVNFHQKVLKLSLYTIIILIKNDLDNIRYQLCIFNFYLSLAFDPRQKKQQQFIPHSSECLARKKTKDEMSSERKHSANNLARIQIN